MDCYKKAGTPRIVNEKTLGVRSLIADVYEQGHAGGNLHIVVDDWNLDLSSMLFCEEEIKQEENPEKREAEMKCVKALMDMTPDERYSALAIFDGFIPPTPPEASET